MDCPPTSLENPTNLSPQGSFSEFYIQFKTSFTDIIRNSSGFLCQVDPASKLKRSLCELVLWGEGFEEHDFKYLMDHAVSLRNTTSRLFSVISKLLIRIGPILLENASLEQKTKIATSLKFFEIEANRIDEALGVYVEEEEPNDYWLSELSVENHSSNEIIDCLADEINFYVSQLTDLIPAMESLLDFQKFGLFERAATSSPVLLSSSPPWEEGSPQRKTFGEPVEYDNKTFDVDVSVQASNLGDDKEPRDAMASTRRAVNPFLFQEPHAPDPADDIYSEMMTHKSIATTQSPLELFFPHSPYEIKMSSFCRDSESPIVS